MTPVQAYFIDMISNFVFKMHIARHALRSSFVPFSSNNEIILNANVGEISFSDTRIVHWDDLHPMAF